MLHKTTGSLGLVLASVAVVLMLIATIIVISSCSMFTQIELTANSTSGHPTANHNGYPVIFEVTGVPKLATLDYGDGVIELVPEGKVTHTYRKAGTFKAMLSLGDQNTTITINILNHDPIVYGPSSLWYDQFQWHEKVLFDMQRRTAGCDNGTPQFQYGALDTDGDALTYTWNVVEDCGIQESIFDTKGNLITGKPTTELQVIWFAGYTKEQTPYPLCEPTPTPPTPTPEKYNATLKVLVQDQWGGQTLYTRRIHVSGSSCNSG